MLTFRLTDDFDKLTMAIGEVGKRHIPRSAAIALTKTAMLAKDDLRAAMLAEFDRPTNFTLNSLFVRPASVQNPVAEIMVKDFAPKGTPAVKYLAPEIYGGQRRQKRFERALQAAGILPAGMYAVPGAAAPLDGSGNVPAPYITRMLSQLRAFGQQGYRANETDKGRAKRLGRNPRVGDWVVVREKRGKLAPGIYQRFHFGQGNALKPVFIFTSKAPTYNKRFTFFETVERTAALRFPEQFVLAFQGALERFGA